jgi:hypothetical protein
MGSGETSPTMVTVHKALVARLGGGSHSGILLDTPYAFQENAADISARSCAYFARSVGLNVTAVTDADLPTAQNPAAQNPAAQAGLAAIRSAQWVFAGPGSPSYALARWRDGPVAGALRDRIAAGAGITVIASAAAAAMGLLAVPVYEIYKAGAAPHWLNGLDLLTVIGLKVVVIPHYDNAEGGTHDTRFCYLGERRLSMLERELAADVAVLGVDEHTALVIDLAARTAEVVGRGGVTVRKAGLSLVLPAGSQITLADLGALARHGPRAAVRGRSDGADLTWQDPDGADQGSGRAGAGQHGPTPADGDRATAPDQAPQELPDLTKSAERRFGAATRERDADAMVAAILDLDDAIEAWATDTDENDNADRARAVLRGLVVRLGQAAKQGLSDPRELLRPAVGPLVGLRDVLRREGNYPAADSIRQALTAAGVQIQDSPGGTTWTVPDRDHATAAGG